MKKKTLRNQLFLKKETIAGLGMLQLAGVMAGCGESTIQFTCDPLICTKDGITRDSISTCYETTLDP